MTSSKMLAEVFVSKNVVTFQDGFRTRGGESITMMRHHKISY